ncbi:ATP-binding cassette domain-containing protein, partial [Enterococcus lactis]|nr:ATP-binding cassette domain-containing protein [Enterococcus lactis]
MAILILEKVSKSFGTNKLLDDLSFSVEEQTIFGFIGKNGAGKTTTMKLILG